MGDPVVEQGLGHAGWHGLSVDKSLPCCNIRRRRRGEKRMGGGGVHLQPHGHFEMQRQGQVLICRPSGPFNLAGAMAYEAAFSQQIAGLRDAPWGIVEVATEFEAAGPEVLARFRLVVSLAGAPPMAAPFWRWWRWVGSNAIWRIRSSAICRSGRCVTSSRRLRPSTGWGSGSAATSHR